MNIKWLQNEICVQIQHFMFILLELFNELFYKQNKANIQSLYLILPFHYSFILMASNIQNLSARSFKTGCSVYSRVGHKVILKDSNLLVFGGTNVHCDFVSEPLIINCQSYQVSPIITKRSITIEGFSLHEVGNKIYLWGGRRPSGISNTLWEFQNLLFTTISQNGSIPSPRSFHSSIIYAKKYMIVYGGISEQNIYNDWYCLDLQNYRWRKCTSDTVLPFNLQPKMIWLETRGILLISQAWNQENKSTQSCFNLYEFRVKNKGEQFTIQIEKLQIEFKSPIRFRYAPTICKFNLDYLYLAIIGGQRIQPFQSYAPSSICSDVWMINLETLQGEKCEDINLSSKYGHQAVFYKDRIFLIGGLTSIDEFSINLQTIDLKLKFISIDRKLCQTCKCIYGLQDYSKNSFSIKCEYESHPKSFIPAKLATKFAELIRNPLKAFGLLIDNSFNMNANAVEIDFQQIKLDQKIYKNPSVTILCLTDNSYGFNKQQLLQSFFTFGYKVQTLSHDSKFEEELAVRKQYGLNLKLASLRLGKSCLMISNTIEDETFVGYFSTDQIDCPQFEGRFNCFYYFISKEGVVSSEVNKHIISKNIEHLFNLQDVVNGSSQNTKIYIIDFNSKKEFLFNQQNTNLVCEDFDDESSIFSNLDMYLKSLYLKPYFGRSIKICKHIISCQSLYDGFKRDELNGQLSKIDTLNISQLSTNFISICLYKALKKDYSKKGIFIYSVNRLISPLQVLFEGVCGIIQLVGDVQISIGKCQIQNCVQQKKLKKYLNRMLQQLNEIKVAKRGKHEDDGSQKQLSIKPKKKLK